LGQDAMPEFSPRQGNSKLGKMLSGGETDEDLDALSFGKYPVPVNAYVFGYRF